MTDWRQQQGHARPPVPPNWRTQQRQQQQQQNQHPSLSSVPRPPPPPPPSLPPHLNPPNTRVGIQHQPGGPGRGGSGDSTAPRGPPVLCFPAQNNNTAGSDSFLPPNKTGWTGGEARLSQYQKPVVWDNCRNDPAATVAPWPGGQGWQSSQSSNGPNNARPPAWSSASFVVSGTTGRGNNANGRSNTMRQQQRQQQQQQQLAQPPPPQPPHPSAPIHNRTVPQVGSTRGPPAWSSGGHPIMHPNAGIAWNASSQPKQPRTSQTTSQSRNMQRNASPIPPPQQKQQQRRVAQSALQNSQPRQREAKTRLTIVKPQNSSHGVPQVQRQRQQKRRRISPPPIGEQQQQQRTSSPPPYVYPSQRQATPPPEIRTNSKVPPPQKKQGPPPPSVEKQHKKQPPSSQQTAAAPPATAVKPKKKKKKKKRKRPKSKAPPSAPEIVHKEKEVKLLLDDRTKRLETVLTMYESQRLLHDSSDGSSSSNNGVNDCYTSVANELKDASQQLQDFLNTTQKLPMDDDMAGRKRNLLLHRANEIIAENEATDDKKPSATEEEEDSGSGVLQTLSVASNKTAEDAGENMEISSSSSSDGDAAPSAAAKDDPGVVQQPNSCKSSPIDNSSPTPDESVQQSAKQQALSEARAKLQRLKLQKKLAAKKMELARLKAAQVPPPIQALRKGGLDGLLITNISSSGPAEKVFFVQTNLLYASGDDGSAAGSSVADQNSDSNGTPVDASSSPEESPSLQNSMTLLARKMELQQKLVEAKEKVERLGKTTIDKSATQENKTPKIPVTREALLKRKEEAERNRALTHYKHLVSKQQILLEKQQVETSKTQASLQDTEQELSELQTTVPKLREKVGALEARRQVLDDLLAEKLTELVDLRKRAHNNNNNNNKRKQLASA